MSEQLKQETSICITAQTFIKALQFVSHAMAREDVRYFLNGVLIKVEDDDSEMILVGTDGHRMAHCKATGFHGLPIGEYLLRSEYVLSLIKSLKPKKRDDDIYLTLSTDTSLNFTVGNGGNELAGKLIDGKFPDYKRVTPDKGKGTGIAGFNCLYLAEGFKASGLLANEKYHGVKFLLNGENSAAKIEVPLSDSALISDAYIVIMPMKL